MRREYLPKDKISAEAHVIEECGEVIQSFGKICRFGPSSYHPDNPTYTNRDAFEDELLDLKEAIERYLYNYE